MKILITGATGYVGRHLIEELSNKNDDLYALVRKTSNTSELLKRGVNLITAEISKKDEIDRIPKDFDIVVHLAFSLFPESNPEINVVGFDNLVNHFKNTSIKRFVYVSSALVYGKTKKNEQVTEDYTCRPNMYFAKQQLRAEKKLKALFLQSKFPYVIIRPGEIFGGNGGFFEKELLNGYINGKIPVIGSGKGGVCMTYIGDLIQGMIKAIEEERSIGEIYNINTPGLLSTNELIKLIRSKVKTRKIIRLPALVGWVGATFMILLSKITGKVPLFDYDIVRVATMESGERNIDKAIEQLGFTPKYSNIESGLVNSYFNN